MPQGLAPVSGVFPMGGSFAPSGDWGSGNPAFAISRGSPGTPPHTPGRELPVCWHAVVPFTFQIQVSHQIQRLSPPISARCAGDTTLRLVAQPSQSAMTAMSTPACSSFMAAVWRLCGVLHKRHYVDGWVMWPVRVFPLAGVPRGPVPAT
jgi:hypothetical protein